ASVVVAAVPADSDPLALLPRRNTGADGIHDARPLVSRNAGVLDFGPPAFRGAHTLVTAPASLHLDAHVPRSGLGDLAFDDVEAGLRLGDLCDLHGHHSRLRRDVHCCHASSWESELLPDCLVIHQLPGGAGVASSVAMTWPSSLRRKDRARWTRVFTAGTLRLRSSAVSGFDSPCTSRCTSTGRHAGRESW